MKHEDIDDLKTFTRYSKDKYYSEFFEHSLHLVGDKWILSHHCEVDGELTFIGIPEDIEDLKYMLEQAGGVWMD